MSIRHPTELIVQYTGPGWGGSLPSAPLPPKKSPASSWASQLHPQSRSITKRRNQCTDRQTDGHRARHAGCAGQMPAALCKHSQSPGVQQGKLRHGMGAEEGGRQHRQPVSLL